MIHIFRADTETGVALFEDKTKKFLYGEICTGERLIDFINNFPNHQVTIFVERAWKDEVQEIFFLLPHLQDIAKVKTLKKVSPREMLTNCARVSSKKKFTLLYMCMGVMLGCALLTPKSLEYKDSVLAKAHSVEGYTQDFIQNQPSKESIRQLYSNVIDLYSKVNVEAITYSGGTYKVVFSSVNGNLKAEDFGFNKAKLVKVSSLDDGKSTITHIYELEGSL